MISAVVKAEEMDGAVPGENRSVEWTIHPLRQESAFKSGLLALLTAGLSLGAAISFEGAVYGLVTLAVLLASLSRYWLPSRYRLDERGIESEHLGWRRRRSWGEFRRLEVYPQGLLLSPFAHPHRLDGFRGLFLRCGTARAAAIAHARRHVAAGAV